MTNTIIHPFPILYIYRRLTGKSPEYKNIHKK